MQEKFKEINRNSNVEKASIALILLSFIHLVAVFAFYYKTKFNLENPLIPKFLAFELFEPYAIKGIILTIGLCLATLLKFLKQNLAALIICILIIAFYYFTSFRPDFTEY